MHFTLTAGAILFASQQSVISEVSPGLAVLRPLLVPVALLVLLLGGVLLARRIIAWLPHAGRLRTEGRKPAAGL